MKPASALPIYYDSKPNMTPSHLPPTPSTSSSINAFIEDTKGKRPFASQPTYGSMSSNAPYLDVSRPITPSQTTISPNDNDGGLYLLWTEQLLRERGYEPSTHHSDESESDDDSSISDISSDDEEEEQDDMYVELLNSSPTMLSNHSPSVISHLSTNQVSQHEEEANRNFFSQLFYTCFAPCT